MTKPYYADDLVTLYHGDCLEVTEWLQADVLVTDPPYGIKWEGVANYVRGARTDRATRGNEAPIANDESVAARDAALEKWGGRPAIVFGSWRAHRPAGTKHRLIWWKQGQAPGPTRNPFVTQDEEIYVLGDGWPKVDSPMRSVLPTTESRSHAVVEIGHPTPKPIPLMEALIERTPPRCNRRPLRRVRRNAHRRPEPGPTSDRRGTRRTLLRVGREEARPAGFRLCGADMTERLYPTCFCGGCLRDSATPVVGSTPEGQKDA